LSVNVVALFSCLIGSLAFVKSPLSPIQLLWVNLIMDSLASLALATETPKPELLMRPPYRRNEYIISRKMVKHILGQAIFQSIVILTILFAGNQFIAEEFCAKGTEYDGKVGGDFCDSATKEILDFNLIKKLAMDKDNGNPNFYQSLKEQWDAGQFYVIIGMMKDSEGKNMYELFSNDTPSRHLTVVFNLFVFMQIFNMICSRKINDEMNIFNGITTNPSFIIVWSVIVVIQVFCTQFFGRFMSVHLNGLTGYQWLYCLLIALVTFPINIFLKFLPDEIWPILGEEDPQDIADAERDYEILRAKGERNQKLFAMKN